MLIAPPRGTRPVSDRAREGLFSSLGGTVIGAVCLDLFAGSGALGIEALSRGAEVCTFVDKARPAAAAIAENLRRTHLDERGTVVTRDVSVYLRERSVDAPRPDLVFLDPPYQLGGGDLDRVLLLLDAGWLGDGGWSVVMTRGHKAPLPAVPLHWSARRQLRYGDSLVILYGP